ncbi:thermonuclease family protein, partial [Sphingobium sp.]|uniref:thermonuclease family protein n=1 Tax=Sphingobium sp. TaxID=1912891 RepID=UPI002C6B27E7
MEDQWPGEDVSASPEADPWPGTETKRSKRRAQAKVKRSESAPAVGGEIIVRPIDGDTARLSSGRNLRVWGIDAPELKQQGWDRAGQPVPIGQQSRNALMGVVSPETIIGQPVGDSYGRAVAPLTNDGLDVGNGMVRQGNALAAPTYLAADPQRQFEYMQAERLARLNGLGIHDTKFQAPQDYRRDPLPAPSRETVAQWWDTPTPLAGMRSEDEQQFLQLINDPKVPAVDVAKFSQAHGFVTDPADVEKARAQIEKTGIAATTSYQNYVRPLTDSGDGATGAATRGLGSGVLASGLDEAGAVVDTLGGTEGRESVFNSDRRLADIWSNNQQQNASILGFDDYAHPYAQTGGELVGGLLVPFGARAKTVAELARVGAAYGGATGFLGTDGSASERALGAAVGVPLGAALGVAGGKALEYAAPYVKKAAGKVLGRAAENAGEVAGGDNVQSVADDAAGVRVPDRIDTDGRSMGMAAEPEPSISQEARKPDYLFRDRPQPIDQPLSEAQRAALTRDIQPRDLVPLPSNEVRSADELAAIDAGRYAPAKIPDPRAELTRQTVRTWSGAEVLKVGPIDLVGWVRLRGGLADQGGELSAMGMNNAARRGMDFVGQEARFGPLVSESGAKLDDAAHAAWEAGYFPDHTERPTVNEFLDALRDTYDGHSRRYLPEDFAEVDRYANSVEERNAAQQARFEGDGKVWEDRSVAAGPDAPFAPP